MALMVSKAQSVCADYPCSSSHCRRACDGAGRRGRLDRHALRRQL